MALLVYVDDLILAGNNSVTCSEFKEYLNSCFHIKDLGPLKYFMGIEVARSHKVYFCAKGNMPWKSLRSVDFLDQNLWIFLWKLTIN